MTDYVIDIQGFRDADRKFIPKEVAVLSLQSRIIGHWMIRAPCSFIELPGDMQQTNNYYTLDVHGLEWHDGDISIKQLRRNLCSLVKNARRIYVHGQTVAKFLEKAVARRIINVEEFSAPSFDELANKFPNVLVCISHGIKKFAEKKTFCAMRRAYQIRKWIHSLVADQNAINSEVLYQSLIDYDEQRMYQYHNRDNLYRRRDVIDGIKAVDTVKKTEEEEEEEAEPNQDYVDAPST